MKSEPDEIAREDANRRSERTRFLCLLVGVGILVSMVVHQELDMIKGREITFITFVDMMYSYYEEFEKTGKINSVLEVEEARFEVVVDGEAYDVVLKSGVLELFDNQEILVASGGVCILVGRGGGMEIVRSLDGTRFIPDRYRGWKLRF